MTQDEGSSILAKVNTLPYNANLFYFELQFLRLCQTLILMVYNIFHSDSYSPPQLFHDIIK